MAPHKEHILSLLNNYRNRVALGYTRTLFPAARMARMAWSKELENFAIMYITKCAPETRPCMSSPQFTNIGSVLDGLSFTGVYKPSIVPGLTEELLKGWFEDTRFVTRNMLLHLTPDFKRKSVSRTVLLMTDRNSHVGCSGLTFVSDSVKHFRLVCTFATDNMNDLPIYKGSTNPGSQCHRRDTIYKNLCAPGESYNNSHEYVEGELLQLSDDIFSIY
ncbi:allergen Tab y 5.0101-like [Drosophila innubila]|uniref:allergen Tab y 5.0101-like n=1 Tax=Drosophila innubila TaxID=198719 RepID=UPI00148DFC18|nr:allergen Tab y 5.0101-like [Drosophila innubila]